jgi:ribulose-5-phosphate 4-epimerase/fuculose-1-phosphate aldolase
MSNQGRVVSLVSKDDTASEYRMATFRGLSDGSLPVTDPSASCSGATEAVARRDVAACYRLIAAFGMSDMTDGFVCGRLPDAMQDIVIGGYGLFPEDALPELLYRRTLGGPVVVEKEGGVDVDALLFSAAVLGARPDFNAVIHAHPPHARVFAALDSELMPISQWGHMFHGRVGAIPFEGDVSAAGTCAMIGMHLREGKEAILLRNHGVIIPGTSVADAFHRLYRLEQAFEIQLGALKTGAPIIRPDAMASRYWGTLYWDGADTVDNDGSREWAGLLRRLARTEPAFAA